MVRSVHIYVYVCVWSVHGIFPARILLWVAIFFSRAYIYIYTSFLLIIFNSFIIFFIWVYHIIWASLVAQMVKNLPAMQETWL